MRLDARAKLAGLVVFVACAAITPPGQWLKLGWFAGLCFLILVLSEVSAGWLVRRLLLALPIVALVGLSVLLSRPNGPDDALNIPLLSISISNLAMARLGGATAKAMICLTAMVAVMHTTTFHDFVQAMWSARLPRMIILTLAFTYRYLLTLADEAARMIRARDLRGCPRSILQRAKVTGSVAGSLFLRSHERSRRVGQAMVLRGSDGALRRLHHPRLHATHLLAALAFAAVCLWLAIV